MALGDAENGGIWVAMAASAVAVLNAVPSAQGQGASDPAERALLDIDSGAQVPLVLEGFVLGPDGNPAGNAVVVSSAGGRAVTDATGSYRLEIEVPAEATIVQVTALGSSAGNLVASSSVSIGGALRPTRVDPLRLARGGSCSPTWVPTFGGEPGTDDYILAFAVYDDGGGPALYVGGFFRTAGGTEANHIAKWDGSSWSALGSGVSGRGSFGGEVWALAVYDDGSGPALYAGGGFTTAGGMAASNIAKWDGSSWSAVGGGMDGGVFALAVYDDGTGPALYVGGGFRTAGSVALAHYIARWDGSHWSRLDRGMNNHVIALTVYDDGGGPALYAGGVFHFANRQPANGIAKWDGSSWSALGEGVGGLGWIGALAVYDDGGGPALYAGGNFWTAYNAPGNHIARWDGSSWSPLGTGIGNTEYSSVLALTVYDDGGGPALYAGGDFSRAGGLPAARLAKWNGSSWSALSQQANSFVSALAVHDDGGGPALFAGGGFTRAGVRSTKRIAKWNGSSWSRLGSGLDDSVGALAAYDDGGGPALYAGGAFTVAGDRPADRIAKWNGSSWSTLGSGLDAAVGALAVYDDGGGPALYAAGDFTVAGGVSVRRIARWDGTSWSALGVGMNDTVEALAVYDDGGGQALVAGGAFTRAGMGGLAKWDGTSWSALGSGMNDAVSALAVYDDGSGPALYAGGQFTTAGGVAASRIARWDGTGWSALGSGNGLNDAVGALAVYDDGSGPALYAGGKFSIAGGVPASRIAKWDGTSWSALGSGMNGAVETLAVHDDGGGPALYAGGSFTSAGGVAANRIAKWDGSSWTPLGSGVSSAVKALVVFDGPERGGPALFAGGDFRSALDSSDSYLARWQGCPDTTPPVLSCPTSVTVPDPRSGPPGEIVTFTVTASDDRDASPTVVCQPPSGSFFPPGVTLVQCKATDGARNQSSCSFPVIVQRKQGQ